MRFLIIRRAKETSHDIVRIPPGMSGASAEEKWRKEHWISLSGHPERIGSTVWTVHRGDFISALCASTRV